MLRMVSHLEDRMIGTVSVFEKLPHLGIGFFFQMEFFREYLPEDIQFRQEQVNNAEYEHNNG